MEATAAHLAGLVRSVPLGQIKRLAQAVDDRPEGSLQALGAFDLSDVPVSTAGIALVPLDRPHDGHRMWIGRHALLHLRLCIHPDLDHGTDLRSGARWLVHWLPLKVPSISRRRSRRNWNNSVVGRTRKRFNFGQPPLGDCLSCGDAALCNDPAARRVRGPLNELANRHDAYDNAPPVGFGKSGLVGEALAQPRVCPPLRPFIAIVEPKPASRQATQ